MPIPDEEIDRRWIWALPSEAVGEVLSRLPSDRARRAYTYLVLPADDRRYLAVRWVEIEQIAAAMRQDISAIAIGALAGLPAPVAAVEQSSMGKSAARELRDAQPGKRLVVLSGGRPIGLLTRELLEARDLGPDPLMIPKTPLSPRPPTRRAAPQAPEPRPGAGAPSAAEPPAQPEAAASAPPDSAPPPPQADTRVINGWIDGVDPKRPLAARVPYELKFNVDQPRKDAIVAIGGVGRTLGDAIAQTPGDLATILVVLEPGDFTLYGVDSLEIVVPKAINAASKNIITFTIEASQDGAAKLNAIFYINGTMFQRVQVTAQVGGEVADDRLAIVSAASGLTLGSAVARPSHARDQIVDVMIIQREPGYQVIAQGGGVSKAFLNISTAEVAGWIKRARQTLQEIVHLQDAGGNFIYQDQNTTIPPDIHAASLKKMAVIGQFLYEELFYGNNGIDAHAMGDLLRDLSRKRPLRVQIFAERFFFPWSFLYTGDDVDNPDATQFWGFKHIIEYLPEFSVSTLVNFSPAIEVGDTVDMAFVSNDTIDAQFGRPLLQDQREFFKNLPGVSVQLCPNVQDLVTLLRGPDGPPLIYFYCHAVSKFPDEEGGVDASRLALTDDKIALFDLKIKVRSSLPPLSRAPLVFLNACESAELSPYLYDGLMPFLIGRGARGMIGTEVETPAMFAAEFAKEFLKRFIAGGVSLGELLRAMRIEYLERKNNIMGLVYALYSSGDVTIQRPGL